MQSLARGDVGDFLQTIQIDPTLLTAILAPSSEGVFVSYRVY